MTRTLPSRCTSGCVAVSLLLVATSIFAQQFSVAAPANEQTARLVAQMVPRYHLGQKQIDDATSEQLFDRLFKDLDPQKLYFLQSDRDRYADRRMALDDAIKSGEIGFAYEVFNSYRSRLDHQIEVAHRLVDQQHDFAIDESIPIEADELPWAASQEELDERWRKRVKYDLLQLRLDDEPLDEARSRLHKRYRTLQLNIDQTDDVEILEIYLTSLASCFDPHSSYMSPNTLKDFQISMRLSLDGIGAALRSEDGYTIVAEVVAGGAADKDGRLKIGDKIIGVGQEDGAIEDIVDQKLTNVVRKIRGPRGSKVRLQVKPESGGETAVYDLVRQKIELKESEVKGEVIETSPRVGRNGRIGVIKVPAFYRDFEGAQAGGDSFKSATRDVQNVLAEFTRQGGVDGIIIDLRGNGGGALTEAIEMTGQFIDKGPVVQVKAPDGHVTRHNDDRPGVLYSGPLVVLCNRASASASEIFAGAIKDYNRGIVIGDSTTHGKGTVQNVMPVAPNEMLRFFSNEERGALKLTIQQFYRVNGDSTQNRGVESDVVLPSIYDHWDIGEAYLDNALPFDRIPAARFSPDRKVDDEVRNQLRKASADRVTASNDFEKVREAIRRYLERKSRKSVSLSEGELRTERDLDEKLASEVEDGLYGEPRDPAKEDAEKKAKDDEVFPQNFYNNEVLEVTLDYLEAVRQLKTVQR
jgi:carboxyl-terminal processing protease